MSGQIGEPFIMALYSIVCQFFSSRRCLTKHKFQIIVPNTEILHHGIKVQNKLEKNHVLNLSLWILLSTSEFSWGSSTIIFDGLFQRIDCPFVKLKSLVQLIKSNSFWRHFLFLLSFDEISQGVSFRKTILKSLFSESSCLIFQTPSSPKTPDAM